MSRTRYWAPMFAVVGLRADALPLNQGSWRQPAIPEAQAGFAAPGRGDIPARWWFWDEPLGHAKRVESRGR